MRRLSQPQNQLYEIIDNLLWDEWDPIGINDIAPRDEYQAYTPQLFSSVIKGATSDELTQALYKIESDLMGLPGNFQKCEEIAKKIVEAARRLALA